MKSVNVLIYDALKSIGVEGEWEDIIGQYQTAGLSELNNLTTELNCQDLIAEQRIEKFCNCNGIITIGPSDTYNIKEDIVPNTIVHVGRKLGNRYVRLIKTNKATIYSRTRASLPVLMTYNIEYDEVNKCPKGVIFTDGRTPCECLVVYNRAIPQYKIDDEIWFSDMTVNLLEEGLKYKLARRFKMPDADIFEEDFETYKNLVKSNIDSNRPLTYSDSLAGSYLDSYYDCLGGVGF